MKAPRGFALIELMIVVAIIAILAALALPAYQDFVARAQVSEGMSLASGARIGVVSRYSSRAVFPADNADAGLADPASITGRYVASVTVGPGNGEITVEFNNAAAAPVAGQQMVLTPTAHEGSMAWQCSSPGIAARHLPSSCR